jgi:hypothetical protein
VGNKWDFAPLVEHHDIDFVRATLPNVGGITEMLKAMALCEAQQRDDIPAWVEAGEDPGARPERTIREAEGPIYRVP